MPKLPQDAYDVVIIGAGIGGLVCGCYLAKAGMKVLIAEQHHKPGGYCTSFKRKGFTFDAAAHSFGGYREGGIVRKVVNDLEMEHRLNVTKSDPSGTIITPDYRLSYWSDMDKTIEEFKNAFPDEQRNIDSFFAVMKSGGPQLFIKMRKWTFQEFLQSKFRNENIKSILAVPLFTYSGLPPSLISFCAGVTIFSEFLMDGGYHTAPGMQTFSDAFAEKFKEYGGELLLSYRVKKIRLQQKKAIGIVSEGDEFTRAKYVISNADARQTFFTLIGSESVDSDFTNKIKSMIPSRSYFVTYLGLDGAFSNALLPGTSVSYFPQYDLEKAYIRGNHARISSETEYVMRMSDDATTLTALVIAPYKNKEFWSQRKDAYTGALLKHIERTTIPGLQKHITLCEAASPYTMWRYTGNYKGAAYGWASMPSQFADIELKKPPCIQNLYLAGHWTTQGIGITGVVYSGYAAAHLIRKLHLRQVV